MKKLLVISLMLNLLAMLFLGYLSFHYDLATKILTKVFQRDVPYQDNPQYSRQVELYQVCKKDRADIVMLGDSITYNVNWAELLNRDVANSGVGSDVTQGFVNRMQYVYDLHPRICFVMGGINDIA